MALRGIDAASKGVPTKAKTSGVCITHGAKVTVNDAAMRDVPIKSRREGFVGRTALKWMSSSPKERKLYDTHGEETMQLLGL